MTQPETKSETKSTTSVLKIVMILLLAIVIIIGSIFAVSVYWAEHQKQLVEKQAQDLQNIFKGLIPTTTPTPSKWTIILNTNAWASQSPPSEQIALNSDSPTDITFSTNNILYNGKTANSYGSFAPIFGYSDYGNVLGNSDYSNAPSQYTIRIGYWNSASVYFPRGVGSPWATGVSVQMTVTTSNAQGSTTFTLP